MPSIPWPEEFLAWVNSIGRWIQIDFVRGVGLKCIRPLSFYDELISTIAGVFAALLAIPFTFFMVSIITRLVVRFSKIHPERGERWKRKLVAFTNKCWKGFLFLCFLVFPPVSNKTFKFLACNYFYEYAEEEWMDLLGGTRTEGQYRRFLEADYSIDCDSQEYADNYWIFLVSFFVFIVGIPLFFFLILWTHQRKGLLQSGWCMARYGFLYQKYELRCWWWELLEMFRKLMLTSVLIFVQPGSLSQIVFGMLVSFVCLLLHTNQAAYLETNDDLLQFGALLGIFLVLWTALLMKVDMTGTDGINQPLFDAVFMIMCAMPLIIGALIMLHGFYEMWTDFHEHKETLKEKIKESFMAAPKMSEETEEALKQWLVSIGITAEKDVEAVVDYCNGQEQALEVAPDGLVGLEVPDVKKTLKKDMTRVSFNKFVKALQALKKEDYGTNYAAATLKLTDSGDVKLEEEDTDTNVNTEQSAPKEADNV